MIKFSDNFFVNGAREFKKPYTFGIDTSSFRSIQGKFVSAILVCPTVYQNLCSGSLYIAIPHTFAVMSPGSITELLIDKLNSDYSSAVFPGNGIWHSFNIFLTPLLICRTIQHVHAASCWFSGAGVSSTSLKPPRVPEQEADGVIQDQHTEV